jgi:hypothetical protein
VKPSPEQPSLLKALGVPIPQHKGLGAHPCSDDSKNDLIEIIQFLAKD